MAEAGRNGCIASLIDDTENRCRAYLRGFMSRKVASPDDPTRDAEAVVELVLATWRGLLARGCASADTPSLTPALRALHESPGSPSREAHAVTPLRQGACVDLRSRGHENAERAAGATAAVARSPAPSGDRQKR